VVLLNKTHFSGQTIILWLRQRRPKETQASTADADLRFQYWPRRFVHAKWLICSMHCINRITSGEPQYELLCFKWHQPPCRWWRLWSHWSCKWFYLHCQTALRRTNMVETIDRLEGTVM